MIQTRRRVLATALALAVAGCSLTPVYETPTAPVPPAYKEAGDWLPATPADAIDRGHWWSLFGDPVLDGLASRVEISNQNVAAATAAYAQARAVVREQRASLFPTVSLDGSGARTGGGSNAQRASSYRFSIGGSWEPDVFGRLRAGVESASASAQASEADLASATLAAQGELVTNYLSLRATDAARDILVATIAGYQRSATITDNRYKAGIVARTDVLQAQTQLANARADLVGLERQRAQLEHAIAVLVGEAPGNFSLAPVAWKPNVPDVPVGIPSALLQRRPDIASAERRVAAANAQIGIARAGYFPSFNLTGSLGTGAATLGAIFSASNATWAIGLSAAQTLFNAGATTARVEQARAAHEQTVAQYRQTVLTAFQDVEDQLSAVRALHDQLAFRLEASQAADLVEQQVLNRYNSGLVSYTDVVTAQVTAFNARRALIQANADRMTAAVALIQALGGGWHAAS